jgi:hypothetical protein
VINESIQVREISVMAQRREPRRNRNRRRFRPVVAGSNAGATVLDSRLLLSRGLALEVHPAHPAITIVHPAAQAKGHAKAHHAPLRVGPTQEINQQFAAFLVGFRRQEEAYIRSLTSQSTGMIPVSATVTAPYAAGSPVIQVDDAAVFGPSGTFSSPIPATAVVGTTPIGQFTLKGSSGNQLILDLSKSDFIPLNVGTTLSATVPVSAASAAGAIFPSYITASTTQLAINLVQYFNSLPIPLPRKYARPHQNPQAGAIPTYVYQLIAGSGAGSLKNVLLAIPLPATPGPDLQIYDAAVNAAVATTHLNVVAGVEQIFAGKLQIPPSNAGSGTSTTSGTGTTAGSTGGTSSGTA